MRPLARTALGAAIAASVALPACGDEDTPSSAEAGRPSKSEFIAQADGLCTQAGERYDAAIAGLPPFEAIVAEDVSLRTMREVARMAPRIAAVEGDLERDLRALEPPAGIEPRWERALATLGARAAAAEEIAAAAEAGDRGRYLVAFGRFDREGSKSSAALRGYGFKVCARG